LTSDLPAYQNPDLPLDERVDDMVSRMTLEEKVLQIFHPAPAIERLGVPEYDWWNECLHGVARAGIATVFPQAIGMAATWNPDLIHRVATAISDEARAKHHEAVRKGGSVRYTGLTFWSPNVNIFRDPRWGRGQETYGECPYLTARMGVAFVRGLQGDDPRYLKLVATPKHYAVHSGPEHDRHHFDVEVSERDLRETYLPAFRACVIEGGAVSVMGAYQRFRGEPCCASTLLLDRILREEWGFDGYVVSDCGAISDFYQHHLVVQTPEEAIALAVKSGCDLTCCWPLPSGCNLDRPLLRAVRQGLLDEATLDRSIKRLFTARFRLGMFDPPERVPYAQIPYEVNDSPPHRALALRTARESLVLLKNEDDLLPLSKNLHTIAVIGPNADWVEALLGNYNGAPSEAVTPLAGIRRAISPGTQVLYAPGCAIRGGTRDGFAEAVEIAGKADVAILVLGLSQDLEGEEGQLDGVTQGQVSQADRAGLDLPGVQEDLLKAVHATRTPVVLVLLNGSPVAVNWAHMHVPAILEAWYPGEEGGTAIAEALFGEYNPGGRLPVTFYRSVDQLPPFTDYDMAKGRTYRYFRGEPLYPFGYGLSYTRFTYGDLLVTPPQVTAGGPVHVRATVTNSGDRAGDEVVQLYLSDLRASVPVPIRQLAGFTRIHLQPGETQAVHFTLSPEQMSLIDDAGRRVVEPGEFEIAVGGRQPGPIDSTSGVVTGRFTVIGAVTEVGAP
jgi:beta-glucosidase